MYINCIQADNIYSGKYDPQHEADWRQWRPPCADRVPSQGDDHHRVGDLPGGLADELTELQSSSFISQVQHKRENVHLHFREEVQSLQMLYKWWFQSSFILPWMYLISLGNKEDSDLGEDIALEVDGLTDA